MKKSKLSITPMRVLQWIANILLLSVVAMFAFFFALFWLVTIVLVCNIYTLKWTGTKKILGSICTLVLLGYPIAIIVWSFNRYGRIHLYDQPDIVALSFFIGCTAASLGAILSIAIGIWQLKSKSLVITP